MTDHVREILHAHLFCGLGGGARGFNAGEARVGNTVARFRCLGGIDVDPASIRDFETLAGVRGTALDLFSLDQYLAFHGAPPPPDWREATPADIHAAFGHERPHIVFLSAPCKGFSGLLAEKTSLTDKYQALNQLTLRGVWLMLEAYAGDPPELIVFENVPRIASRGRPLLDQIGSLLRHYGYVVAETTHDCGELGELAQSRKRFLLVARHMAKVPPFLYEPPKRRLRGVGEVLDRLPMPGDLAAGGAMHRVPSLQWKTWVRLAFVEAGSDWRSLNRLAIEDGYLRDFAIEPDADYHHGCYGVRGWDEPAGTVTSRSSPSNGAFTIADPRIDGHPRSVQTGVRCWDEPSGVVTGKMLVGGGPHSVADPRVGEDRARYSNAYRIVPWTDHSTACTSARGALAAVADPRGADGRHVNGKYRVTAYEEPSSAVIAASTTGNGAFVVADPRATWGADSHRNKLKVLGYDAPASTITGCARVGSGALSVADPRREHFQTGGHYGVVDWNDHAGAVSGSACHDNGPWSVADPRAPAPTQNLVCVIRALDGTWHRPFTTLELAALQSLFDPEDGLILDGASDSGWRERIGNAVPSSAAQAIASTMGVTLLLAWTGESFMLSDAPIWVRPMAIALSVKPSEIPA